MAVQRVAHRVARGGHDVPEDAIRRRYTLGLRNFFRLYMPIATTWAVIDTSLLPPALVAEGGSGEVRVMVPETWRAIVRAGEGQDAEPE